jgi:hypothetical protein
MKPHPRPSHPLPTLAHRIIIASRPKSVNIAGPVRPPPDKALILDSLAAIARGAGRPPSRSEFVSLSGISEHQVSRFFPTWNAALRAAGLRPYTFNLRLEDRELLEDWGAAVRKNRKIPARRAYYHLGKFDHRTFERRFGPWSKLPEVFRNFAKDKPEWADVLALLPAPVPKPSPKRAPDSAPNSAPSPASNPAVPPACPARPEERREPRRAVLFSPSPEGSTPSLEGPARFSPSNKPRASDRQSPPSPPPGKLRYQPLDGRPSYGRPMDFRGLRHEPVNEQGVVLLFGMVARELGYIVEAIQSGFPDCEAKRQISPQRWQRVHIEFEFESRNFRDHGHSLTGCDIIVCWRHNWPDCPPHIEILELSSLLQSLPTSDD